MTKDLRPALREFLLGEASIVALVEVRVYPVRLPQGVKLASIVYTRVSGAGDYDMTGRTGLSRPRMQIDCWAPTANEAASLAILVEDRLDGFRGVMGTDHPVTVQGVFCSDERETYDDVAKLFGVARDYFIWHEEL